MKGANTLGNALLAAATSRRGGTTGLRFVDRKTEGVAIAGRGKPGRAGLRKERLLSWRELAGRAETRALVLLERGLAPKDRAALFYTTGEEFFESFFGVVLAGGVPVPMYPPVRLGRLEEYRERTALMLAHADVSLVLAEKRLKQLIGEVMVGAKPRLGVLTGEALRTDAAEVLRGSSGLKLSTDSSELAFVQFSSGSTRLPRAVGLSHRAVLAQARMLEGLFPDSRDTEQKGVSWLPLYHDMGLIGGVFTAMCRPADLVLLAPEQFLARPALWLRAISHYRATVSPAPNFAYAMCCDRIQDEELEGVDLSCWQVALNGAEAVQPETLRRFEERFAPFGFNKRALTPVYGLAEASLAVTFSATDQPWRSQRFKRDALSRGEGIAATSPNTPSLELVSVGTSVPGFSVEIRSTEDGARLQEGQIGRIFAKGPSVMEGYLGEPAATHEVLGEDGFLDTGDLGFQLAGELYITGRAKDVIIVRGRNYQAFDLEGLASQVTGVRAGRVVAVSHHDETSATERLLVFAERAKGRDEREDQELAQAIQQQLLGGSGLRSRVFVLARGALPRTSSGKLRRQETLSRFLAGTLGEPSRFGLLEYGKQRLRSRKALRRPPPMDDP